MKKPQPSLRPVILFLLLYCIAYQPVSAQCNNADFELGNFTGWTATWGDGTERTVTLPLPPPFPPTNIPYCFYPDPFQHPGLNQGPDNANPNSTPLKNHFIMTGGNDLLLQTMGVFLPV